MTYEGSIHIRNIEDGKRMSNPKGINFQFLLHPPLLSELPLITHGGTIQD
jgi:hypothetical protein